MKTRIVNEGAAHVQVYEGKITKKDIVFFNPEMKFNRDISVACLKVYRKGCTDRLVMADILSGCGIRGIRYMLEVPDVELMILNDMNPSAVEIITKNIERNNVKKAVAERMDANVLLSMHSNKLNYIDIDPFGSPAPFLDNAARAVRHGGAIGVTATDLGPLAGTYPKTCLRRYGAKSLKTDTMHETGVRILAGHIIRVLSKYDKGFRPKIAFASRHYYRIFGTVTKSRRDADKMVNEKGYLLYCRKCGRMEYSSFNKGVCECGDEYDYAGPLYTGNLFDDKFAAELEATNQQMEKFVKILKEESGTCGILYDIHEICSRYKLNPVKQEMIVGRLKKRGYRASMSVFGGHKVRTDAPMSSIIESIKE